MSTIATLAVALTAQGGNFAATLTENARSFHQVAAGAAEARAALRDVTPAADRFESGLASLAKMAARNRITIDEMTAATKQLRENLGMQTFPEQMISGAESFAAHLGSALSAAFALHEVLGLIKSAVADGAATEHGAIRLGISVADMSRLAYAAHSVGLEMERVTAGMDKLEDAVAKAVGGDKELVKFFSELHLNAKDLMAEDPAAMLRDVADALGTISNADEEKSIIRGLFGRSGGEMLPMLQHLKELQQQSDAAGYTMTKSQADAAEHVERRWSQAWDNVKGFISRVISNAENSDLLRTMDTPMRLMREHLSHLAFDGPNLIHAANVNEDERNRLAASLAAYRSRTSFAAEQGTSLEDQIKNHRQLLATMKETREVLQENERFAQRFGNVARFKQDAQDIHELSAEIQGETAWIAHLESAWKSAQDAAAQATARHKQAVEDAKRDAEAFARLATESPAGRFLADQNSLLRLLTSSKISIDQFNQGMAELRKLDPIQQIIDHLKEMNATFGMSREQIELYKLQIQGADAATIAHAKSLMAQHQVLEGIARVRQWLNGITDEGVRLAQRYEDQQSKFKQDFFTLAAALVAGKISWQQYAEAVKNAAAATGKIKELNTGHLLSDHGFVRELDAVARLLDKTITPLEHYKQQMREIMDLRAAGFISDDEAMRAADEAKREIHRDRGTVHRAGDALAYNPALIDPRALHGNSRAEEYLKNISDKASKMATDISRVANRPPGVVR